MNPVILGGAAVVGSLALFLGAYALMLAVAKPRGIDPAPASQERPAEATLLGLAARHYLEGRRRSLCTRPPKARISW
ncbi:hypothetical protein [Dactylosporangium sp. NPDC051484]|uniref:hypothetical protein n=1 Tax=Dactylosporangium sp. NPDC051484 TaxID=3154942 RepID=UPI00344E26D2